MFRDEVQAARAIRLLLSRFGIEEAWTDAGPTASTLQLRYEDDIPLPPQQRAMLLAAWSLWSPVAGGIPLGDVVRSLDREGTVALCSLMVAYVGGADAVDAWIETAPAPSAGSAGAPSPQPGEPEAPPPLSSIFEDWPTLDVLSLRYVRRVLVHVKGNRSRAASLLGVDRRTVSRVLAVSRRGLVPGMQTQRRRATRISGRRSGRSS
jgi:hypothetical protein